MHLGNLGGDLHTQLWLVQQPQGLAQHSPAVAGEALRLCRHKVRVDGALLQVPQALDARPQLVGLACLVEASTGVSKPPNGFRQWPSCR